MPIKLTTLKYSHSLQGKRVLLRLDINTPLERAKGHWRVADDTRIREALPAIERLHRSGAIVIIAAHLGEPKGRTVAALRMAPVARVLESLLHPLGISLYTAQTWNFSELRKVSKKLLPGEVYLLENLRFQPGEEKNDLQFAKELATLGELYINEAFSVSHRPHASLVALCKLLPHYAGWHLAEEVHVLERVRTRGKRPFVVIVGGGKVHDKITMMLALAKRATTIIVGGVPANTVLKVQGVKTGKSRVDKRPPTLELKKLLREQRRVNGFLEKIPLLQMPIDVLVAKTPSGPVERISLKNGETIPPGATIFDVGPESIRHYSKFLRRAHTVIWNGPLGVIEVPRFRHGSVMLARIVAARSRGPAFSVVGGGETLEVLSQAGVRDDINFCSTGGGAMLEFLSGAKLPGIEVLRSKQF